MTPMELGHLRDATRSMLLILRDMDPAQEQVADRNRAPRADMGGAARRLPGNDTLRYGQRHGTRAHLAATIAQLADEA